MLCQEVTLVIVSLFQMFLQTVAFVSTITAFGLPQRQHDYLKGSGSGFQMAKPKISSWNIGLPGKLSQFCHNVMCIVQCLKTDADQVYHSFQLHVFAYTGINLRDSVSLFSRVII